ncbi:MAG: peptidase T [Lentisphaerae bacterium]|nr:peptidase T [Lentisphaerota bacterium]
MENLLNRFLTYTAFDTQSDENSLVTPSTARQFKLAEHLRDELLRLGVSEVVLNDQCYLYAKIPASAGWEKSPVIGFIAHLDTSDAAPGDPVKAQVIRQWDGRGIRLGSSNITLQPEAALVGHTLITTDGTTLLGADDKAGIACIVSAVEELLKNDLPHGALAIAFTPDEEIGRGADFFDVEFFGADYAYTVDGGEPELIEWENFNAAGADVFFKGLSYHPGYAKDKLINAQKLAMEFDSMLPAAEVPEKTSDYEGFFHLTHGSGNVSNAELHYIIRDHDRAKFEQRKALMLQIAGKMQAQYGQEAVQCKIADQYYNMREVLEHYLFLVEEAKNAIRSAGLTPAVRPIRGGTDGARLSFMQLPCPNLGYGAYNAHSLLEYADLEGMQAVKQIILYLINSFAAK